ncbi:hypothetical protein FOZ63_031166 [Perkinsus olseni]|uniref:Cyclic nucleotide-binding domain-containing protein n=1 Tax=Perkinsus olseni TaxID=32597 RepID=A0A7J6UI08_PEROL|nr:hypothetical protein FOZ63_031166 [Perkinsus olseni]
MVVESSTSKMSPQIIFAILFGAIGQALGQGTLFSREQIENMNLEKNVADLEEASTEEKLLDAIGSIPTEIPLGALESSDDEEEGPTSEGLDVGQNPVRAPDYSGVLAGLLVLVEGPNAGGRAGVAHRGHFRMGTFESGPECFAKNHIWRSKRAESALEFLGPFIQCRMLVEGEVLALNSSHYYVVNRGRLKIPAHGGEVSTILTTGGSFGEAGLLGPSPESEKQSSSGAREILTLARKSHIHQSLAVSSAYSLAQSSLDSPFFYRLFVARIHSHRRSPSSTAVQLEEARAMEWCDVRFVELGICRDVLRVHSRFRDDLRELLEHPAREVPPPFDDGINSRKHSKKPARQPWGYGLPAKRGSVVQQPSKWSIRRPQSSMSEEIKAWAADESLKQRKAAALRLGNHSPGGGLWSGRECLRQAMHTPTL